MLIRVADLQLHKLEFNQEFQLELLTSAATFSRRDP